MWTDRASEVLAAGASAISAIPLGAGFDGALDAMFKCQGKIVATGSGTAGFVARKFAATLSSTGTPSGYLHPGDSALHFVDYLGPSDCVVVFSPSGDSPDLVDTVELAKRAGCKPVICLTSNTSSALGRACDWAIDMGPAIEPSSPSAVPAASLAVMSVIGDAIALLLVERRGAAANQYQYAGRPSWQLN